MRSRSIAAWRGLVLLHGGDRAPFGACRRRVLARDGITRLPVTADGVIDLDNLVGALATAQMKGRRPFVSVMAANNETGAIQPVAEVASIVHEAGGILHSDAIQAAGKMPFDLGSSGADMVSLSAHKLGGPKGVGALVLARRHYGRALDQGWRSRAAAPGRDGECGRHRRIRRRRRARRQPSWAGATRDRRAQG